MNNSVCTSYEQSKSLLELGLDPNTADMKYDPRWDIPVIISEYDYDSHLNYNPEYENTDIPAWSLTALLALMPKIKFFNDEDAYEPCISRYGDKYICHYNCSGADEHWYIEDNPIDAAYNMVCWLKENNKI